jgi:hypothetical protein
MNGKKAKALRRLAKQLGHYNNDNEYKVRETKKVVYYTEKDGTKKATQVSRYTIINPGKIVFRRMKQAYKNGELAV